MFNIIIVKFDLKYRVCFCITSKNILNTNFINLSGRA